MFKRTIGPNVGCYCLLHLYAKRPLFSLEDKLHLIIVSVTLGAFVLTAGLSRNESRQFLRRALRHPISTTVTLSFANFEERSTNRV